MSDSGSGSKAQRLEMIKKLGELLFTRHEVQIILGDATELDPEEAAYMAGALEGEAQVRASILKSASTGSAAAQKQWMDLIEQTRDRNARED